jgi:hypothetical protein
MVVTGGTQLSNPCGYLNLTLIPRWYVQQDNLASHNHNKSLSAFKDAK